MRGRYPPHPPVTSNDPGTRGCKAPLPIKDATLATKPTADGAVLPDWTIVEGFRTQSIAPATWIGGFPVRLFCVSSLSGGSSISAPLPEALRARLQKLIAEGGKWAAALPLKRSAATGVRWDRQVRATGRAGIAAQARPKGPGKLAPHQALFDEPIRQDADITLPELTAAPADAAEVRAHPASIGKFLHILITLSTAF